MSCYNSVYNQQHPIRTWSRIQLNCQPPTSISTSTPSNEIFINLQLDSRKSNVLQYYKNSSQLTKNQRYAQIAKGAWTNRTTTWATQSDQYSNPNTTNLLRVNSILKPYPSTTTTTTTTSSSIININCITPTPNIVNPPLPSIDPSIKPPPPVIPPPPPPPPGGGGSNNMPPIIPVIPPPIIVYPDEGSLLCNTYADPCTGEILRTTYRQSCFPTTDSDVPGPIQLLCRGL
jgi:hypothetical protein